MQVQPFSSAAQAAGITSQSTAKDKSEAKDAGGDNSVAADIHVEQSGSSQADRDAQGQGDGLGERRREPVDEQPTEESNAEQSAALLPGEEPGELDILG